MTEATKQARCIECNDTIYYELDRTDKQYAWPGYEGSGFCSERCGFVWAAKQWKHTRSLLDSIFNKVLGKT